MFIYTYIVQRISQTQQLLLHKNVILGEPEDDSNALFIKLVKSSKFTLQYTIISLLHVSVFNDHHQGALSVPD